MFEFECGENPAMEITVISQSDVPIKITKDDILNMFDCYVSHNDKKPIKINKSESKRKRKK